MAEARSAVSYRVEKANFLLQVSDEEVVVRINRNLLPITGKKLRRAVYRRVIKVKNSLFNAFYPAPPAHWVIGIGGSVYSMIYPSIYLRGISEWLWNFDKYLPENQSLSTSARALIISTTVSTAGIYIMSHARRFLLRALLSYQGWLYDNPREQSKKTLIWGFLVKVISGQHGIRVSRQKPLLYSNQDALPSLPVPSIEQTCSKFLKSVKPILNEEENKQMQSLVESFKKNEGKKLQRYLVLKSWFTGNYVADWWLNYVYLRGRSPILINSNYYILDCGLPKPPTRNQIGRAAKLIHNFIDFKYLLDKELVAPLVIRDTVPMCMNQYERIFATVRIPGKEMDTLEHLDYSNHILVIRKGVYYSVDVYDDNGNPLSVFEIENQLKWIERDSNKNPAKTEAEGNIAALTSENRTIWANAREEYFGFGINKASLDMIDKALFVVTLSEESHEEGNYGSMARSLFHGSGGDRWSDKSFNLIVFVNGKAGLNVEHSWADAPVMAHAWEYSIFAHNAHDESSYDENGFNIRDPKQPIRPRASPNRLKWDFSLGAEKVIMTAFENTKAMISDINLELLAHLSYGKGFIKKCKVSPDAYVQLAMQLAYKRDSGKFALTYESSMTRLFKYGRTETVRPVTVDSAKFVISMDDPQISKKDKIQLLRAACDTHQESYRDCMTGKGIDRHLFALYIVSQGINIKSEFLNNALSMKWRLSTSQQPQNQTDFWDSTKNPELISPGGGFGPVADDGYGVSYMIAGEDRLFFHISSKRSSVCNSQRFGQNIVQALKEIKELFEEIK